MPEQERWDDEHVDGSRRGRTAGEDPGAYIGHEPERSTETIPGGVQPEDERVAAVASQPGPVVDEGTPPHGHRTAERANDDRLREAGDRE
ncbi:MAG TPA: hypothetical protein VM344_00600 [Vitreimonas sp.]|nr:hypothetical protein [Vitreimonas sp.]